MTNSRYTVTTTAVSLKTATGIAQDHANAVWVQADGGAVTLGDSNQQTFDIASGAHLEFNFPINLNDVYLLSGGSVAVNILVF